MATAVRRAYAPELTAGEVCSVRYRSHAEMLAMPNDALPGAQSRGSQRTSYAGIDASYCRTAIVHVPAGQTTPAHNSLVEHVIVGLEGRSEWLFDGQMFVVGRYDQLFIPARVFYRYRSVGGDSALFLAIINPAPDGWPCGDESPTYLSDTPEEDTD
jgi:quercetin dioxygenase-like cupin family protein